MIRQIICVIDEIVNERVALTIGKKRFILLSKEVRISGGLQNYNEVKAKNY